MPSPLGEGARGSDRGRMRGSLPAAARLRVAAEGCPSSVRCADNIPRGGSLLGCGLMVICPPRRAILSVDPPAPHKPALFQRALHVDVIGVGVGAHRQALPQAPVNTELPDAAHLPCRRHPVDRCVEQVFGPGTVLHDAIGRLVAGDQAEHGLYGPPSPHSRRRGRAIRPCISTDVVVHYSCKKLDKSNFQSERGL